MSVQYCFLIKEKSSKYFKYQKDALPRITNERLCFFSHSVVTPTIRPISIVTHSTFSFFKYYVNYVLPTNEFMGIILVVMFLSLIIKILWLAEKINFISRSIFVIISV